MNLKCKQCSWETDSKHFGFIQSEEDIKKHGANHLCMICYHGHTDRARLKEVLNYKKAKEILEDIDNAK